MNYMPNQKSKLLPLLGILAVAIFVLPAASANSFASQQSVSYPIAFQFSLRIDPYNNYWYVNVTNVGSQALTQFGVLLFNSSGYEITANSTALIGVNSLAPGSTLNFKTVCSDYYYSGTPCTFLIGKTYGLSVIAWIGICSCDHEITITGMAVAKNQVYSVDTYPQIALVSSSKVTSTTWNFNAHNEGTKRTSTSSEISWSWNPCNNPAGCYGESATHKFSISPTGFAHQTIPIAKPHAASKGTDALVTITANYADFAYPCWTAQLTMSENLRVG
jgi:hypothetical protein